MRRVRSAIRRKHNPEEKIRIVLEGFLREVTVNYLCRPEGIKPHFNRIFSKLDTDSEYGQYARVQTVLEYLDATGNPGTRDCRLACYLTTA